MPAPDIAAAQSHGLTHERYERNSAPVLRNSVTDHGSKTLATVALVVGAIALGAVVMFAVLAPQITAAQISAASAEAVTTAKVARTDARMALDDVQRLREALMAKGFDVEKEH